MTLKVLWGTSSTVECYRCGALICVNYSFRSMTLSLYSIQNGQRIPFSPCCLDTFRYQFDLLRIGAF